MPNNLPHFHLLGVRLDAVTISDAVSHIVGLAADHRRRPVYVTKPYVEFLDRAAGDGSLRTILNGSYLSIADGVALVWATHYLYAGPRTAWRFGLTLTQIILRPHALLHPLPDRAAGTNFTWPLLEQAAARDLRVALIGGLSSAEIQHTAAHLRRHIPGLTIVTTLSGRDPQMPLGQVSDAWITRTAQRLEKDRPDLTLVGMGFPLQESAMARLVPLLSHGVLIGEGGTFDYEQFGGRRPKAPAWLQHIGLEWLWRLLLQPSRWRRQLSIPRFIWRVWRSR